MLVTRKQDILKPSLPNVVPEKEKLFNLIDSPWIKAVRGNDVDELSIRELFENSHEYTQISGELSLQDMAVFRVVMAVLRSAITHSHGVLDEDYWKETWSSGRFDMELISNYLDDETVYDSFYLFHPERPFYQTPDLTPIVPDNISPIKDVVMDAPKSKALMTFSDSSTKYENGMSFPESARWLVTLMNYDVAGPHTGTIGDDRVATSGAAKNKSYTKKTALSLISSVQILGDSLFETLMLNNIPQAVEEELEGDSPIWEVDPPMSSGPRYEIDGKRTRPEGILQLLTWPSRRIRLFRDQDRVTHYISTQGDSFEPIDTHRLEPMSSYKPGEEDGTLTPFVQSKNGHFWRGYDSLLQSSGRYHQPLNVEWLGRMRAQGVVENRMYRTTITTARYDVSMSSRLTDARYDVNPLPSNIIGDPVSEGSIIFALGVIEHARKLFWGYGINSSMSTIQDPVVAKSKAENFTSLFLDRCEKVFYEWLSGLSNDEYQDPHREIIDRVDSLVVSIAEENERKTKDPTPFIGTVDDKGRPVSLVSARNILIGSFRKYTRNIDKEA